MDRRLLFLLVCGVFGVLGCSRDKAPPPSAAATANATSDAISVQAESSEASQESPSIGVAGLGGSGSGFGGGGGSGAGTSRSAPSGDWFGAGGSATPSPRAAVPPDGAQTSENLEAAMVEQQRQMVEQQLAARARAEEVRRRALEELQGSAALGAFGGGNPLSESPPTLAPAPSADANPLRMDTPVRIATQPGSGNPLRQAREPRISSGPPMGLAPSPAAPAEPSPGSGPVSADNSPSGGSAPPGLDGLGGGSPIGPRAMTAGSSDAAAVPLGATAPLAAKADAAPPTVEVESEFDVVEVLYGTDRRAGERQASDAWHLLLQFVPTLAIAALAICLIVVGVKYRNWWLGTVAVSGLAACFLLGYDAADEVLSRIRGATHQGPRYTTDRSPGGRIEVGRCEVSIPRTHVVGEVESPSVLRFEISEDVARHLVLQKTERLANAKFHELLRQRVGQSARRELFVFVHGFNVSFEDAARRTAQIHHDLKFEGAPIFFSWPANDKFIFTYPADETNVVWSVPHLKQFLLEIVKESQAQSINLIAHSMGNRALAAALREIELEMHDQARLFNQVILAAPDIDADDFRNNIAPAMQRTARGLTLYASSHDEALLASQFIHRGARAGDAGDGLTVVAGIDTIDVTAIDQSFFGHSYYGSSHPVLNDLKALLSGAIPPRDRTWLSPAERDGLTYWIFQPAMRTAAAGDSSQAR